MRDEGPKITELQRAEALAHDETFIALVHTACDAHGDYLRDKAGGVDYEDMAPDVQRELADLELIKLLLSVDPQTPRSVYKLTSTSNAPYVKLALTKEVRGDRLALRDGDSIRGPNNPVHQLSIKVLKPRQLDPYHATPEDIIVNRPKAVVNITPEEVFLDRGIAKFIAGTGITLTFFDHGSVEVFGSKSAGDVNYRTDEPLMTINDDSITAVIDKLPGI